MVKRMAAISRRLGSAFWDNCERIGKIFMAEIEVIPCGSANVYVIHANNTSILIDTGTEKYKDKVLKVCQGVNVKLIVLTHGHFDHCQNALYLSKHLNCPIGISAEDAELLQKGVKRKVYGKGIWGNFYAWASNCSIRKNKIESMDAVIVLENEMSLREYGIDGKVIKLPGHTKGSIGILLQTGEAFIGDAMQNIISPSMAWCYEDYETAEESFRFIQHIKPQKVYCGHGRMFGSKYSLGG